MATTDAQQRQDMNKGQSNPKILVTYFSAMGTTARAAEKLVNVTGGELYARPPSGGTLPRALSIPLSKATI